jgi:hypothetical protein
LVISLNTKSGQNDHMTCLYCGKKLGFFSRYKDTPFCSEEHLRTHQDELERALMERLGSKAATPAKSLSDLAAASAPPTKSMLGLDAAVRAPEPKPEPKVEARPEPKPEPKPEPIPEPVAKKEAKKEVKKAEDPIPSLHEDYLFQVPGAQAALETQSPLIPAASFAIIVQADCCTPSLPDFGFDPKFPFEETSFDVESASISAKAEGPLTAGLPEAAEADGFGEPWLELPTLPDMDVATDFNLVGEEVPLEYEASNATARISAFGQRPEIEPRIRLRYPYAASQVTSSWNELPTADQGFAFTDSTEWAPIEPVAVAALVAAKEAETTLDLKPSVDVPLTVSALMNFDLNGADLEDFGDSLRVMARSLSASGSPAGEYAAGDWPANLLLPVGGSTRIERGRWMPTRSLDRVAPVPFPSLFQLGPALPPRPEGPVG